MPLLRSEGKQTVSYRGTVERGFVFGRFHGERVQFSELSLLPYDVCLFGNKFCRW
jgi:hypothetical protein